MHIHRPRNDSEENYLEVILILSRKTPEVRSVDIANEMEFSKASVSVAMKNLRQKKHITVSPEGFISLTNSGRKMAEALFERFSTVSSWLISLGVDTDTASEDAGKMEHILSDSSFRAIQRHIDQCTSPGN